ncbi:MAG: hypothetical protein IPN86_13810 [Saprospiraceae bacterium]|nr:hypothetical protein [Saprospiraceae bacterium]
MKRFNYVCIFLFIIVSGRLTAQNVGINHNDPLSTLDVAGSIRVQSPITFSSATPTPAQIYTMNNTASIQNIPSADSVFRVLDPGGAGPYFNNMQGNIFISNALGCKINFNGTDFGIGPGDTVWISKKSYPNCRTNYLHRYLNTTSVPNEIVVGGNIYIIFRSNRNGNNGVGFDMTVTRLYAVPNTNDPINALGNAFYFDDKTGAIRVGLLANGVVGPYSTAMGYNTTASGNFGATAMGYNTTASGDEGATAIGDYTIASGDEGATAFGSNTTASGDEGATALGIHTTASGYVGATALGIHTTASGDYGATALGIHTTASGYVGATALGSITTASGDYGATALGYYTTASGYVGATALGNYTTARSFASLATGRFNDTIVGSNKTAWVPTDPLVTVGNGISNAARSNALTI